MTHTYEFLVTFRHGNSSFILEIDAWTAGEARQFALKEMLTQDERDSMYDMRCISVH